MSLKTTDLITSGREVNILPGKAVYGSSEFKGVSGSNLSAPRNAIDGKSDSLWSSGSCFAMGSTWGFLNVDMGRTRTLKKVVVITRSDSSTQGSSFYVYIGNNPDIFLNEKSAGSYSGS